MNKDTEVKFYYSIGFAGEEREEVFTLGQLGYDPEYDTDLDEFLQEAHDNWSGNFADYGWYFV